MQIGIGMGVSARPGGAGKSTPFQGADTVMDFANGYYRREGIVYGSADAVPNLTYTRTGDATAWRKDGTLVEFAPNVMRRTDAGVTIEGQRTNLFTRWDPTAAQVPARGNCADVAAPAVAPLAGRNWVALDNTNATAYAYLDPTITASTTYTISVLVETTDGSQPVASATTLSGDFGFYISGFASGSSAIYQRVAGNVWLVSLTVTVSASPQNLAGVVRYDTNSTRPLKFSGFQLEQASAASSPIITTGAAATVGADVLSLGSLATTLAAPFSVVMDTSSVPVQTGLFPAYVTVSAGSPQNWIAVYRTNSGGIAMNVRSGNALTGIAEAPTPGTAPVKVALAVSGTSVRWAVNGVLAPVLTATVAPVGMDRLHPLSAPAGTPGGAVGRSTLLFRYALTDAELVEMTR